MKGMLQWGMVLLLIFGLVYPSYSQETKSKTTGWEVGTQKYNDLVAFLRKKGIDTTGIKVWLHTEDISIVTNGLETTKTTIEHVNVTIGNGRQFDYQLQTTQITKRSEDGVMTSVAVQQSLQPIAPALGFKEALKVVQDRYATVGKELYAAFQNKIKDLNFLITSLGDQYQQAVLAIQGSFQQQRQDLQQQIGDLKTQLKDRLLNNSKEFVNNLIEAVKSGDWQKVVSLVKTYFSDVAKISEEFNTKINTLANKLKALDADQQKVLQTLREQFSAKLSELRNQVYATQEEYHQAAQALTDAATQEIQALCDQYGVPFDSGYVPHFDSAQNSWTVDMQPDITDMTVKADGAKQPVVQNSNVQFVPQMATPKTGASQMAPTD